MGQCNAAAAMRPGTVPPGAAHGSVRSRRLALLASRPGRKLTGAMAPAGPRRPGVTRSYRLRRVTQGRSG
eukprot:756886-Hanusia_phi.AAC.6